MDLVEYVLKHVEKEQSNQSKDHIADLVFFKIKKINNPDSEEFKRLVKKEFSHWLDGKEHSYLETGGDIGDQGLALMAMGLGELLGIWELSTPNSMVPFLDKETRMKIAGAGYVTIKAKLEEKLK